MNHLQVNTAEFITTQGNAFEIICHAQVILRLECVINFGMAYCHSLIALWLQVVYFCNYSFTKNRNPKEMINSGSDST